MKNIPISVAVVMIAFSLSNCSEKKAESASNFGLADTTSVETQADAGIPLSPQDRKFIRTAEVRFKVNNVQNATNVVEDLVDKYKGFIVRNELSTQVFNINDIEISEDSILRSKSYEASNEITLRIPNEYFEKTLRELQPIMAFLDNQTVSAEDVSLSFISNELQKKRFSKFEKRFENAIDEKGKKLSETSSAEENLYNHQSSADQNQVLNLKLKDEVNYSTITLHLYQPIAIMQEKLPNIENTHAFQPNLFLRIWQSVREGWYIFEDIVVVIFRLWFVILLAFGGFWLYKKRVKVNL
ncbi:uncharacterized protein DUF4349 [Arcicella aurantiaca]|uniref:Uncharacterized protein DUF4349 n=1 Tax=Arcicella aurantiaca TaxID=591202 RepID=A0A316EGJ3_9BACT|nr:DUF4349 domain-containing protein [Arcicella aurantiaca]PWK28864.1 uncharacterized protein DUF4349 [Arcicella aurantiaca]